MLKIHFEELELCRCVLARLLQSQSGPRVPLRRVPPMFTGAARLWATDPTRTALALSRSSSTITAGRYRALVLVGSLAEPALFPENRQAAEVSRLERVTAHKSSPPQNFYRSWSVSSVFAPELPPPPNQPYMQPYAGDPAPSLAQPK